MQRKNHLKRHLVRSGLLSTCLLVPHGAMRLTPRAYAQATTASLGGTVTDTTGAVVPNAQIVLKSTLRGDTRTSVSNAAGVFNFAAVSSGDYVVTITAAGFKAFQQTGIHLDPGDERSVRDIKLEAGGATETVEVTTATDTVNLDSGEQSSLISAEEIQHLSVEGRDVTELLKILPGFAISRGGAGNFDNSSYDPAQVQPTGALGQYAANGTPVNGQALLFDGVDITDPGAFGGALQNVNYEQVAEVKVQTSSFTADTAHGPIVINAVGKSGGAHYHGSLYTFARTYQLNSTDWIAKYSGQTKPPDRYVYPGFTFGGPVLIPGTKFNSSKKLTFFGGAEDYAQRNAYAYGSASGATLTALVPTPGMRTGDFSQAQLQQYLGTNYQVLPAGTHTANGLGCNYLQGGTFQSSNVPDANICTVPVTAPDGSALANGNVGAYLDPLSKIILNEMPLPNTASNGTYNWITTNLINNDLWQARGRVDYSASDKDKLFAVYSIEKGVQGVPQNEYYSARGNLGGINVPGGGLLSTLSTHLATLNYTHVFTPSLTNSFYAGAVYFTQDFVAKTPSAVQNNPYQGAFNNGSLVQPTLEDYGNDGLPLLRTPDTTYGGIFANKQVRIAGDNVTKVLGKHTFEAGVFYQWDDNPQVAPFINTNGTINLYYIGGNLTDHATGKTVYGTGAGNGGNFLADFAEGQVFQYSQTNIEPEPNLYFWNLAEFVQDHWRIAPRLTLDLGVRLEHMTPWQDAHGLGIGVFTPANYAADAPAALAGTGTNAAPGIRWHSIDPSIPNGGRPTRPLFAEPRAGFAWDMTGKGDTVLRGGFGWYRAHDAYNDADNQEQTTLGLRSITLNGPLTLSSIPSYRSTLGTGGFVKDSSVYAFDPNDDQEPQVFTYNVALDQRLPGKMLLELAYVGNRSNNLLNDGSTQNTTLDNINSLPVGALFGAQPNTRPDLAGTGALNVATGVNAGGDNCYRPGALYPVFQSSTNPNNCSTGSLSQGVIDSFKPYPIYNHIFVPEHNAYSNYNGLQVGITKQSGASHFNVNYTFSKALGILGTGGSATYSYPADPFNYANDYSNMPFDRRHIFNASYSYTLGNVVKERFIGGVTNGWELSGITNYQSGANLPSIISSNFGIGGTINVPVGTVATVGANTSTCPAFTTGTSGTTTAVASCSFGVSSTALLGTPDVNLQPRISGFPNQVTQQHQYINSSAFGLPALGTEGAYRYGFLPGPGFFNSDLTAAKRFKVTESSSVQLRVAAFNFINHANNTFTTVNPANYTLTFSQASTTTDLNQALASANAASASPQFGLAPLREGRRIMELGLRYDF